MWIVQHSEFGIDSIREFSAVCNPFLVILYDGSSNPYFFLDADKDGQADKNDQGAKVNYNSNWTPKLLEAAFNYQYTQKDPGKFVHNPKYVMQFLIDSIESLGGDVSKYTRPEVPAPAQ